MNDTANLFKRSYLTLTSVVFESRKIHVCISIWSNLTLTSVVFELAIVGSHVLDHSYLTLTSVVFEFDNPSL